MALPGKTEGVSSNIFESLFTLYMVIALVVGALVLGWLAYILVKYRARPGSARPRDAPRAGVIPVERGHPIWSYIMALAIGGIMFGLAFSTISAVTTLETPPPDEEHLNLEIIGFQFGWRVVYRGEGGIPIAKINEWTVPVDTAVVANVTSQDVWHNFAIPSLRIRIDVVPGQVNNIWFKAHETDTIDPVCVQLCGNGHALMKSTMHIVSKEEYRAWIANQTSAEYAKLENGGQVVNVTYDGAAFTRDAREVNTTKAFAVRVVNQAPTEQTFASPSGQLTLASGQSGLVHFPANGGALRVLNGTASQSFGSVS